jgi:hypothetical protein
MSIQREQIEKAADRIRGEFLLTLRELERRRDEALDVRGQLTRHKRGLELAGVAAVIAAAAVVAGVILNRRRQRHTRGKRLVKGISRAWKHPERIASRAKQRPVPAELGRKLAGTVVTTLAGQLVRRAVHEVLPAKEG